MRRDLACLLRFLPLFNGTTKYIHGVIEEMETLHIDACLQSVGGVWKQYVYTGKIPDIFQKNHFAITHYEMVNILVAIRTWGKQWESKRVVIKTDNMAVVEICRSGYTRDVHLAAIVRNIWLLTAQYDISRHFYEKVDTTNSVEVVKNVMAGNCNCLRNVNVLNLKDKCTDLKAYITQQKTVFGFLPISNLKRFRISEALKPNKILTEMEFDPVTIHEVIKSTGKPNFEKAYNFLLKSILNF